jgi:hypothetical protein
MHGASIAGLLHLAKRAIVETLMGILQELLALSAAPTRGVTIGMMITAIDVDHGRDGAFLAADTAPVVGRTHARSRVRLDWLAWMLDGHLHAVIIEKPH